MENLDLYNKCADVPQSAQRAILGGKLKGKTDINPMWRIKKLTELFGECGKGWNTTDEKFWTENGANGEIIAFCSACTATHFSYCSPWGMLLASRQHSPVSQQLGSPRAAPLYPVEIISSFLIITAPY